MAQTIENIVDPNDSALTSEMVKIGDLNAYVSRPKDGKNLGTVVVIHENRGLVGHIKDVTRRFAKEGFAAIGVDLMSRIGGSDKWNGSDEATKEIQKITGAMAVEDLTSAVAYMKKQNYVNGKVGVVGYCWGGSLAFYSSTRLNGLTCAVGYYGSQIVAGAHEIPKVPTMLHFGDIDASIPLSDVDKIRQARPDISIHVYPGRHGFNCDARANYEPGSAQIALGRTLEFFWKHVG